MCVLFFYRKPQWCPSRKNKFTLSPFSHPSLSLSLRMTIWQLCPKEASNQQIAADHPSTHQHALKKPCISKGNCTGEELHEQLSGWAVNKVRVGFVKLPQWWWTKLDIQPFYLLNAIENTCNVLVVNGNKIRFIWRLLRITLHVHPTHLERIEKMYVSEQNLLKTGIRHCHLIRQHHLMLLFCWGTNYLFHSGSIHHHQKQLWLGGSLSRTDYAERFFTS